MGEGRSSEARISASSCSKLLAAEPKFRPSLSLSPPAPLSHSPGRSFFTRGVRAPVAHAAILVVFDL